LVVFPESTFPDSIWAALQAPIYNHHFFLALVAQAQQLEGAAIQKSACGAPSRRPRLAWIYRGNRRERRLHLEFERPDRTGWSILNAPEAVRLSTKSSSGRTAMRALAGCETNLVARLLICARTLIRCALCPDGEGEQVHMSSYPPIWPTRPPGQAPLRTCAAPSKSVPAAKPLSQGLQYRGVGFVDSAMRDAVGRPTPRSLRSSIVRSCRLARARSRGRVDQRGALDQEGILYAEIDVEKCVEPKQFTMSSVLQSLRHIRLNVDRSARIRPISGTWRK